MISVVDDQARPAHKTVHRRQDGFKAHLDVEPETGLVTACELTKASGPTSTDATVGIDLLTAEDGYRQVMGDNAYGTGDALAALDETGHDVLIKFSPGPLKTAVPGGVTIGDFGIDLQHRTVTCPAGQNVRLSPSGAASSGPRCSGCPFMARCTTARRGQRLKVGEHFALQKAHRPDCCLPRAGDA